MIKLSRIKEVCQEMTIKQWVITYAVIALLTFGWAGHHNHAVLVEENAIKDLTCTSYEQKMAHSDLCYGDPRWSHNMDDMKSLFSGLFWPMYWVRSAFDLLPSTPNIVTVEKVVEKEVPVVVDNSSDDSN